MADADGLGHLHSGRLVDIVAYGPPGVGCRSAEVGGPSACADERGDIGQRRVGGHRGRGLAFEQRPDGHLTAGMARLEQRHGAHTHSSYAPHPGVPGDVVGRLGRARQDELAPLVSVVALPPDAVPQRRGVLPFVEQSWDGAGQHRLGRGLGEQHRGRIVESCLAPSEPAGRPSLAAGSCAVDEDRANAAQRVCDFALDEARPIAGHRSRPRPLVRLARSRLVVHTGLSAHGASSGVTTALSCTARCTLQA